MNSKKLIFICVIFLLGCSTTQKVPIVQSVAKPAVDNSIAEGKDLYENRCGKCHKLFAASDYTAKEWPGILNKMQNKAKITDDQKAQIFAYLSSEAKK